MTLSQEKIGNSDGEKDVHLIYKNIGETPLETINRFREKNKEFVSSSITYAGRLDPIAEGLLILLTNDKVHDKEKYLVLDKTYEVEILWSFSTDTEDLLGKITNSKFQIPNVEDIKRYLEKSVGKFEQIYPAYSSKTVDGKPLFQWAREGRLDEIKIPSHEVSVFNTEYLGRKVISNQILLNQLEERINAVSGDFRQEEILEKWKKVLSENREYALDKFKVIVSSGFYVRQFVSDMSKNFQTSGTTFSIKRVKIGDYAIAQ